MSIVTLTFGVSPEKIKAACEDTNLSDEVVAKLSQLSQVVVDLHVNEEGQVTGGFVPDLRKKEVESKPKPAITFESVIAAYRKTRDEEIPALNDKVSLLKEVQQKREDWLAAQLTKQGVDNVKIKGVGMALFSTKDSCTVADRTSLMDWVQQDVENRLSFLAASVVKDQVRTYIDENQVPPPGVNYQTFKKLEVRKA